MGDEDLQLLLDNLARHNEAIERLLAGPRGQSELARLVNNELALLGYILETAGETPADEGEALDETPEEQKQRWIGRAKEWLDRNGKDIFKELLLKANNLIASAAPTLFLGDPRRRPRRPEHDPRNFGR